jgi:hypothetical protein
MCGIILPDWGLIKVIVQGNYLAEYLSINDFMRKTPQEMGQPFDCLSFIDQLLTNVPLNSYIKLVTRTKGTHYHAGKSDTTI